MRWSPGQAGFARQVGARRSGLAPKRPATARGQGCPLPAAGIIATASIPGQDIVGQAESSYKLILAAQMLVRFCHCLRKPPDEPARQLRASLITVSGLTGKNRMCKG